METKKKQILLPKFIEEICSTLEENGYAAYAVGGCVRDILRGESPHDYDVATAASPEKVKRLFAETADTGLRHGTVTVICPEGAVEVTTFRQDGAYTDKRRPDSVTFVSDVQDDLARRDFTVNAMAFSPTRGLCDPFAGQMDLEKRILRTVGPPKCRFTEDALRILRLFRFSAQLSFSIDADTLSAAYSLAESLLYVSKERIFAEIKKFLERARKTHLASAAPVLSVILPAADLSAENTERIADCNAPAGKWALLCGEKTEETLRSLRAPRTLILSAAELASYKKGKHIVADVAALRHTAPTDFFSFIRDDAALRTWEEAKKSGVPMCPGALCISGKDIEKIGFCGREIGEVMQALFMYAIENPANNNEESLWEVATWMFRQKNSQKA